MLDCATVFLGWEEPTRKSRIMPHILYVHIGTHKTATKSIQAFLRRNARLLASEGICVPLTGVTGPHSGHHNICWQMRSDPRFNAKRGGLGDLVDELTQVAQPKAVISSEDFEYLVEYPEALSRFEAALDSAGWVPTYIVFFRHQEGYARSLYYELQKHGLKVDFDGFISEILRNGRFVMHGDWCFYFDYAEFVRRWTGAIRGDLRILSYETERTDPGIIQAFTSVIGCSSKNTAIAAKSAQVLNVEQYTSSVSVRRLDRWRMKWKFSRSNRELIASWGLSSRTT